MSNLKSDFGYCYECSRTSTESVPTFLQYPNVIAYNIFARLSWLVSKSKNSLSRTRTTHAYVSQSIIFKKKKIHLKFESSESFLSPQLVGTRGNQFCVKPVQDIRSFSSTQALRQRSHPDLLKMAQTGTVAILWPTEARTNQ